jgi:hypothetical protein
MKTIILAQRSRRPARPRRRAGFGLALETMEHRLVLSLALPLPPPGASAVVAEYHPPIPVAPVTSVGVRLFPPTPLAPVTSVGPALYPPDPCTIQSYRSFW